MGKGGLNRKYIWNKKPTAANTYAAYSSTFVWEWWVVGWIIPPRLMFRWRMTTRPERASINPPCMELANAIRIDARVQARVIPIVLQALYGRVGIY